MKKNQKKIALITGITGQDGSYLAKFLLKKGYTVHGMKRRTSLLNTDRIDDIYKDPQFQKTSFYLHHGDMTDAISIMSIIKKTKPTEIYNLAAQSHVAVSFEQPEYTANLDALGTLRILESIRLLGLGDKVKFYQASTSELYGNNLNIPQNENTTFLPQSPYAIAKLYAFHITKHYRDAYNFFACNGILFNHESPVRGETFVTRKITIGLTRIKKGKQKKILLGNIYAKRDWGHAKDFVKAQWKMLQQKKPDDFVIATGEQHSVKDFINEVANVLKMKILWKGNGINEKCYWNKKIIIEISKKYFRPLEVPTLLGDISKAKKELKWSPETSFKKLVEEMTLIDLKRT